MEFNFEDKLKELSEDKEFIEKVCLADDPEQVKSLFLEKNIEMDDEAANAFVEKVRSMEGEEIDEEELENVSGGGIGAALGFCALSTVGAWAIVGVAAGVVLGVALVKLYKGIKYGKW